MADNKTLSWSDTRTTAKNGINASVYHNYPFTDINTKAAEIPAYSQINSATLECTGDKDPDGTLKSGAISLGLHHTSSTVSMKKLLKEDNDCNYAGVESLTGVDILSYIKSKTSNAGYIEHSEYDLVRVGLSFTALYKQGWTSTAKITWNYNEPRAIVSVSKSGEGTVTGAGTYHYGNSYTIKATPATGYKFVKWSDGNTNASRTFTVNADFVNAAKAYEISKSYQAVFEKQSYTLTVTAGTGGTVSGGGSYSYGSTATLKATPNTGYKFVKWSDGNTSATRTVTVTGAATYTATFEKLTYTVTFKDDNGTTLKTETVAYGNKPTPPTSPTKAETAQWKYTFDGWYDGNGNKWTSSTTITAATTYTARYTSTVQKYIVRWYNDDGTLLETDTDVPYGTKPTYNGSEPTKAGNAEHSYQFAGWNYDTENGITPSLGTTYIDITAQFTEIDNTYTVQWVNEGKVIETDTLVPYGAKPDYNGATPTKASDAQYDYTFIGWSASVTDPAKPESELETVKGNVTYTAVYSATVKFYPIRVILFDSESTHAWEYNSVVTIVAPAVNGYKFVKWADGNTDNPRTITVTGEATYQAVYEKIPIPIKVNSERVSGVYAVPTTKTIVYVISGTVPTVETKADTVDDWNFLVSNTIPANGYPLEKLFINGTRVY